MAQGETSITVVGNLVADPELRFTPAGAAVANFRIASTPRRFNRQTSQWEDGEAMYLTCNVWRQAAENVAESLSKGMRVIVQGRLRQRSYESREGERRSIFEVEVDEVGPSLSFATAQVTRASRGGGQGGYGNQGGGQSMGGQGQMNQGTMNQGQQQQPNHGGFGGGGNTGGFGGGNPQQQAPDNDPWNSAPASGGFGGPADGEPPF
jgi:single-stranded DNA-binding protein